MGNDKLMDSILRDLARRNLSPTGRVLTDPPWWPERVRPRWLEKFQPRWTPPTTLDMSTAEERVLTWMCDHDALRFDGMKSFAHNVHTRTLWGVPDTWFAEGPPRCTPVTLDVELGTPLAPMLKHVRLAWQL